MVSIKLGGINISQHSDLYFTEPKQFVSSYLEPGMVGLTIND